MPETILKEPIANLYLSPKFQIRPLWLFVGLLFIVAITYGSVLAPDYAFADDYFYLWSRLHQSDWVSTLLIQGALQARPLDGLLFVTAMTMIKSISAYVYLRAFTLLEASALAYLICDFLMQAGWTRLQSLFLSLSLISLPSMQVIFAWSSASFFVLAAILSLVSIKISLRQSDNLIKQIALSLFVILSAMAIYQPWAMLYWLIAAIYFTAHASLNKEKWISLLKITVAFGLACVLNFLMLIVAKACFKYVPVSPGRTHLTKHIGEKMVWFIKGPLVDTLNCNHLMANTAVALIIGVFMLTGLWLYFQSKEKKQSLFAWLIALSFIPLSYLPNLAISESYYTYRTEFALGTLVLFYLSLSVKAFTDKICGNKANLVFSTIIVASSIVNLFLAHKHMVEFFVAPQLGEAQWIKSQLRGDFGKARQEKPIYPQRGDTTAPFNRHDEFGMPSFACPWVREPGTAILRNEIE